MEVKPEVKAAAIALLDAQKRLIDADLNLGKANREYCDREREYLDAVFSDGEFADTTWNVVVNGRLIMVRDDADDRTRGDKVTFHSVSVAP